MKVGIGLPNAVRGVNRAGIVEWAQRAERAGFASLGTLDRLVYANYESLIALAAAAAVTERIELVTDILIPAAVEHAAAGQAGRHDRLAVGRAPHPGPGPGGTPRRLRGQRRRLQPARAHLRPAAR
jgi:alkanesulfonate monooxygenase SsuD/methylene tetrahydromethanopterin reductase-like flavin-dependent oxidoreductase (luciferase family)